MRRPAGLDRDARRWNVDMPTNRHHQAAAQPEGPLYSSDGITATCCSL